MVLVMRIVIFGATGRVGRLAVAEALARGHEVVAFQRRPEPAVNHPRLRVFTGDIYDSKAVLAVLKGNNAVISALGSWKTPKKDILASGMRSIIPGMHKHGISRIVSLTGADARAPGDTLSPLHRLTHVLIGVFAGKVLRDGEAHIALLAGSDLAWTVIRSPIMRGPGRLDSYRLGSHRPMPWVFIDRQAVAKCLVDTAEQPSRLQEAPFIHSK